MKNILQLFSALLLLLGISSYANSAMDKVSIQLNWKYQFEYAGFIMAKENGFYKEIGFDVELKEFTNSTQTIKDLLEEKSTFAISDSLFMIERQEHNIVLLANYLKQSPLVIATNKNVVHPKDLESKLFMTSAQRIINTPIYFMFKHLGVDFQKVKFKENTYDVQDLIDNNTDAMEVYRSNELYKLEKEKIAYNVLDPKDYGFSSGAINMFTTQENINKYGKERIEQFIKATNKGWRYALNNPNKTVQIIHKNYNNVLQKSIDSLTYEAVEIKKLFLLEQFDIGDINIKEIYRWYDILNNYGLVEKQNSYDSFIFNHTWREQVYTKDEIYLVIALSSFIIFIMLIVLYFSRSREKLLQIKNKEIESKNLILFEQSKLASMGEMIGNISHQWRQPLSVISTGVTGMQLMKELGTLSDKEFYNTCQVVNENAQYLSRTIEDFRNFIKGDRVKQVFLLKDNISSFLQLVEGRFKSNHIDIILDLDESVAIDGYENELIQCLMSLANNARDALLEKEIEEKYLFLETFKENDNVIIIMKDNAGGIPVDVLPKIFEPYFTTKHQSQGTGLGLHLTYDFIVNGMSGTIMATNVNYRYNNQEYIGAQFKVCLPLH